MSEAYRKKVDELAALLEGEDDKEEAFEAIRALIDQIVLSPEHGQLKVDLYSEIAAILMLSQANKSAVSDLASKGCGDTQPPRPTFARSCHLEGAKYLERVLINRQPMLTWMRGRTSVIGGKADMARTCQYVR